MELPVLEKESAVRSDTNGLAVLAEVHRMHEERLARIESGTAADKLERQVKALKAWVRDALEQNTLLTRAVEELEAEAIKQLLERRRCEEHTDQVEKLNELRLLADALRKENFAKDREIKRLNNDVQQYEQTLVNVRSEANQTTCRSPWPRDAVVMAGRSCVDSERENDLEPVKDYSALFEEEIEKYQKRISQMELNAKSSRENVRGLRLLNAQLAEEAAALRRAYDGLQQQCRAVAQRAAFKDEIIREMRRQLRRARAQLEGDLSAFDDLKRWQKESESGDHASAPRALPSLPRDLDSEPVPRNVYDDNVSFNSQ